MSPGPTMERVYLELKARILSAEFPPGTRLGPAELAKLLDASPTPVRDALYRLSGERVVESWHLEGFRQPLLAEGELHDLYGWRAMLLGLALRDRAPEAASAALPGLAECGAYPDAAESLFRTIAAGCVSRELRFAIVNAIERSQMFFRIEIEIDPGARDALAAMEEDYRFALWTALRSKITTFHRRRAAQTGRVIAALPARSEPL